VNGNVPCVREFRTRAEVDAAQFREGLIAFQQSYSLENVLSLSRIGQETFWKLKNETEAS